VSRRFDRISAWTVDHPWVVLAGVLAVSALALLGYIAPERLTDLFQTPPESADVATAAPAAPRDAPPDVDPVSLSDSDAVLVVYSESDKLFTADGVAALRAVVDEIESLDYVRNVLWMDRVPELNIFGLQQPLLPNEHASERQFSAARETAQAHPLVDGQLLSDDGRTALMLIKYDWLWVTSDDDVTNRVRETAEKAAEQYPGVGLTFLVTGRAPVFISILRTHEENQMKYQLIGYGMVILMAVLLFRGFRAVFIVALAPSVGVFWTLGMLRFFELDTNQFNDVLLPVMLSLVGLTDGVHLMVEIRRSSARGCGTRDAAYAGLSKVGLACALTSITTAIGFGSLCLAHHQMVREFGWSCVIGVTLTFVAVVTVIPLASSTWLGRRIHVGHEKGLIDRNLVRIGGLVDFVLNRAKLVSQLGILATAALLVLVLARLRPDERRTSSLPSQSESARALAHMDQAFGGLELSHVNVRWSDAVAQDSPEVLLTISEVDELLRSEPLIGHPLSIRNFLDALPGEGPALERMSMIELLPPPLKRAFYTPEYHEATVSFRVQDLGIAAYGPVFERVEAGLVEIQQRHPEFDLELAGSAAWRWRNLYQIVVDLAISLGSASVIIFLTLGMVYRSVRIGLISVIPNVFPLVVTAAFLVLTGQSLEIVSVCAFTVCLGIAVDDTIHFLTRYQEERPHAGSDHEAIRRAFTGTGTALIMTTAVLVAGFVTVIFSDMRDQRIFATMGGLTIGSALFGDLVFLPAMLLQFAKPRDRGEAEYQE